MPRRTLCKKDKFRFVQIRGNIFRSPDCPTCLSPCLRASVVGFWFFNFGDLWQFRRFWQFSFDPRSSAQIRVKRLPITRSFSVSLRLRGRFAHVSVGLSASRLAVIHLGQQTIAVVWRVFVRGNGILRPILVPLPTKVIIRVIFEEKLHIFSTVAAKQFDVPCPSRHPHCLCFFSQ